MKVLRKLARVALGTAPLAVGVSGVAQAAIDTGSITTAITEAGTAGAVIGAAVIVMLVGMKVFKWIRSAL